MAGFAKGYASFGYYCIDMFYLAVAYLWAEVTFPSSIILTSWLLLFRSFSQFIGLKPPSFFRGLSPFIGLKLRSLRLRFLLSFSMFSTCNLGSGKSRVEGFLTLFMTAVKLWACISLLFWAEIRFLSLSEVTLGVPEFFSSCTILFKKLCCCKVTSLPLPL